MSLKAHNHNDLKFQPEELRMLTGMAEKKMWCIYLSFEHKVFDNALLNLCRPTVHCTHRVDILTLGYCNWDLQIDYIAMNTVWKSMNNRECALLCVFWRWMVVHHQTWQFLIFQINVIPQKQGGKSDQCGWCCHCSSPLVSFSPLISPSFSWKLQKS